MSATKMLTCRIPLEFYIKLVTDAAENKMTLTDLVLMRLYSHSEPKLKNGAIIENKKEKIVENKKIEPNKEIIKETKEVIKEKSKEVHAPIKDDSYPTFKYSKCKWDINSEAIKEWRIARKEAIRFNKNTFSFNDMGFETISGKQIY